MINTEITWVLIADQSVGKLFEIVGDNPQRPRLLMSFANPSAREKGHNVYTGKPGRFFSTAGPVRHAIGKKERYQEFSAHEFARAIGNALSHSLTRTSYDHLILAAGPKFLGMLRESLSRSVNKKILSAMNLELTHLSDRKLKPYIQKLFEEQMENDLTLLERTKFPNRRSLSSKLNHDHKSRFGKRKAA